MSATLLQRLKTHIIDDGGLLSTYPVRYYQWTDADLGGAGAICLFRMTGTGGSVNSEAQHNDVSLFLLVTEELSKAADDDLLEVLQYLRANYSSTGVFNYFPVQTYTGPVELANGRRLFEMVIRCGTEDH